MKILFRRKSLTILIAVGTVTLISILYLTYRNALSDDSVPGFEWFFTGVFLVPVVLLVLVLLKLRQSEALKTKLTERNASLEKSLREVSDYKYALDESAIVAITDQRGIIRHVNDNFCKISKYSREELIGNDHRIINSGYHSKEFIRSLWQTISKGQVWKGELRNRAKDGTIYWVYTSIVPLLNGQGRPHQYLAIRSDITEAKIAAEIKAANIRLELEIKERRAELADVLDMMTDAFAILDDGLRYRYVNKKFTEMAQKDAGKIIGEYIWDVFPNVVGSPSYHAINTAVKERRYIGVMDYSFQYDVWFENHIYPTPRGLSMIVRDVTPQKRAERKLSESERLYRQIASSIPGSVIILIDKDYRYFLIEGDMIEKVGYARSQLLDRKASEVLSRELLGNVEPMFKRVFNGETFGVETNVAGYDFLVKYVPLLDEGGSVYAAMVASTDITELKSAQRRIADLNTGLEKKIAERTSQLEMANKELESFSYSVAHDLRAPLRGVGGYATMLTEDYHDKLDDEGRRLLGEIKYNAGRMGMLIDNLLTFSRLGRKEVRKAVVDARALIDEVLSELPHKPADIQVAEIHPAYGDFALLKHVFTNLLSNAVKYSSKKEHPVIRISSNEKNGMTVYSIVDNGVGFDMLYADKLFGVFQRLHSNEEFDGTGVGLAIVKRIVNRHGGDIWAEAKEGEGATFHFTLPIISGKQSNTQS